MVIVNLAKKNKKISIPFVEQNLHKIIWKILCDNPNPKQARWSRYFSNK